MVIFIEGSEGFLAKEAIAQIKQKYLDKNPDGVELVDIDVSEGLLNWADLQAVPLFAQTRLIIIRRVGLLLADQQASLASYLENLPTSSIIVIWDEKPLGVKSELAQTLSKVSGKTISAQSPMGGELVKYLKKRATHHGVDLSSEEQRRLLADYQGDLWGLETELTVLSLGGQGAVAKAATGEPFALYRAVQTGNWDRAKSLLRQEYQTGAPVELLIGSIASALRKARADEARVAATEILADVDLGLKTGLLDGDAAVALLSSQLPHRRRNRVEWEELWEETLGG